MSAMKALINKKSDVLNIVASRQGVHVATSTDNHIVVKAFHHATVKALKADLAEAGFLAKSYPFLDGRYNVTINLIT